MHKKYLVCNLKATHTKEEMIEYEEQLKKVPIREDVELIICPSYIYLYLFQNEKYTLGAQDVSEYTEGAHTGEVTATQLESMNVRYALVGHSERRQIYKEEENAIINKIKKSYHSHIHPIYFIGESLEQKIKNQTEEVLTNQLKSIIDEVPDYKREKIIIVYEPVWSIGSGKVPNIKDVEERTYYIKKLIYKTYGLNLPVLYGGSVNINNVDNLLLINNLDGFAIGESSQNTNELESIYKKL